MSRGVIDIVEAAYAPAGSDREWIDQLATTAHPILNRGAGISVFTFDSSSGEHVQVGLRAMHGLPKKFDPRRTAAATPAQFVQPLFSSSPPAVLLSERVDRETFERGFIGQANRAFGFEDVMAIIGRDPVGRGCLIAMPLPTREPLPGRRRAVLACLAAHLAAGWRLRQALAGQPENVDDADAVFDLRGRLKHASSELDVCVDGAKLRQSVEQLRRARQTRRLGHEAALELWRALVDGRWSIVQRIDTDGKRFLLARRNAPGVRDLGSLTRRESLVIAYAAMGHSNKLIAYELGIDKASVSVLLKCAMQKLGVKSRVELSSLFGQ